MTTTKPYLLRAIFEWSEDNGFTPQVLVDAEIAGVEVPSEHVVDGQIVLNIASSAVQLHVMDNDCLSFSARFSGVERDIFLPIDSILAIFARENSQGIFFDDIEEGLDPEPSPDQPKNSKKAPAKLKIKPNAPTSSKRSAAHLKIIK